MRGRNRFAVVEDSVGTTESNVKISNFCFPKVVGKGLQDLQVKLFLEEPGHGMHLPHLRTIGAV